MYKFAFRIGMFGYVAAIHLAYPFHRKARQWVRGRRGWRKKLRHWRSQHTGKVIWFHCASLGEFEQGRPLIEEWSAREDYQVIVSFFSPSGIEPLKNWNGADGISYLPADLGNNAKHWIQTLRPELAVFVKYELWPGYLDALHQAHIRAVLVSASFPERHWIFKNYHRPLRRRLGRMHTVFVQTPADQERLQEFGLTNLAVAGDTRADRVMQLTNQDATELRDLANALSGQQVILAGSTWASDEKHLAAVRAHLSPSVKWIIAPHHIAAHRIKAVEDQFQGQTIRWSNWDGSSEFDVLIMDQMGLLSRMYRLATMAYVGGGFDRGIHNTLEPAASGKPIVFGPKFNRFEEAKQLIAAGAAIAVANQEELREVLTNWLNNKSKCDEAGDRALQMVKQAMGATQKIMQRLDA